MAAVPQLACYPNSLPRRLVMSDSYSDRWLRWFEEQHPHLKRARETQSHEAAIGAIPASPSTPPAPARFNETARATYPAVRNAPCTPFGTSQPSSGESGTASVEGLLMEFQALRLRLNMSQRAFAEQLGTSPRTYQDWEQGRRLSQGPSCALLRYVLRHPPIR
ncbi:helix-turn-helix domain-containing protein [Salinicola sp. JS01]|uniref:helix-turn-helix domain-containing protein n=1 Tax=Salinicola sp. JS01 TaxID=3050071 RepID=UPI0033418BF2